MNKKKSILSRLLYFTPWRSVVRAKDAIGTTRENLSEIYAGFKNSLPHRQDDVQYPAGSPLSIDDDAERFNVLFEENEWDQEQLDEQIKTCSRTKKVSLICLILSFVSIIYTTLFVQLWLLTFLLPAEGCLVILCAAQAFKFSLYETQLIERSLFGAREFFNRPDFISRLVG